MNTAAAFVAGLVQMRSGLSPQGNIDSAVRLIEEAKKQVGEAKAHHENAKTKRDHGDAVRKAKVAAAYAEEAITLQNP